MNHIDYDDLVCISISSTSHFDIKEIANKLHQFNVDGKRVDINSYLENLKRKYYPVGLGIGVEPSMSGWDQVLHSSIKDGLTDDENGYTVSTNDKAIWHVTAEYKNGNIVYVSSIDSVQISLQLDVHVSYLYNNNKSFNRVQVNSTKYKIRAD